MINALHPPKKKKQPKTTTKNNHIKQTLIYTGTGSFVKSAYLHISKH